MAKILLVEDDENLREIYQARLMAEGYEIASAKDGEEALVVAKQEKPDLIIADIMMPRISGFEMLDILRNTEGMKHAKVIMLTALGQAEDKARADKLGADRYLVKSQVTLEDIVHAASELLGGESNTPAQTAPAVNGQPQAVPTATPAPVAMPTPAAAPQPVTTAPTPNNPANPPAQPVAPAPAPTTPFVPAAPVMAVAQPPASQPVVASTAPSVNQPTPQPTPTVPTTTPTPPGNPTPSAPAVSISPASPTITNQTPPQTSPTVDMSSQAKEVNNASQLADAVNNLINGASNQPTPPASRGSVPPQHIPASNPAGQQASMQDAPLPQSAPQPSNSANVTPVQAPPTPRAFPTGAPATTPTPPAPAEPIKPAPPQPEPNVTKPEIPTAPKLEASPSTVQDSIGIKDKKMVTPLKAGNSTVGSDLNDLLQKENDRQGDESFGNHQPGQIFTPNGNTPGGDPNNISL